MIWFRINIDYLSKNYNNKMMEISTPCGDDEEAATLKYFEEVAKNEKCIDNKQVNARIDLTKYIYNKSTGKTNEIILNKNY